MTGDCMVDDAQYPEGLFTEARQARKNGELSGLEVQRLADSVRLLESTVSELRKDLLTIRESMADRA